MLLLLTHCKKSEGDPAISFRTRKARLEGQWQMTSGTATYNEPGYNESYTFDGDRFKGEVTAKRIHGFFKGDYVVNLKISKEGLFTLNERLDSTSINCEGKWSFNTGVGEAKNKENVTFFINEISEGFTTVHFFNRFKAVFMYSIKELRNKKMIISSSGKMYSSLNGNYATFSTYYTFEQ